MSLHSPTGQWWQYPLSSPSYRFTQINNHIRMLDERYKTLSSRKKDKWITSQVAYPWWSLCVGGVFQYVPGAPVETEPEDQYRGVNVARLTHGLPLTDEPPVDQIAPDNDTLGLFGFAWTDLFWSGRSAFPTGDFFVDLRYWVGTHAPESGPAASKFRWGTSMPIEFGVPLNLGSWYASIPGYGTWGYLVVAAQLCQKESAPFYGGRILRGSLTGGPDSGGPGG